MKTARLIFASVVITKILLAPVAPAHAITFNIHNSGGFTTGSDVYKGFMAAAAYWSSVLTDNVTINFDVGYVPMSTGLLGTTSSHLTSVSAAAVEAALRRDATSALDARAVANLPALSPAGGVSVITSGYANAVRKTGVNVAAKILDTDDSANNKSLAITSANAKALGFTGLVGSDASLRFSSNFAFDFNPRGGIGANSYDFVGIAVHEIGHALGFISGVDTYDYFGGRGPGAPTSLNLNTFIVASTLDLFRYAGDPTNLVPGTAPVLDWSVGTAAWFSVDGGATRLDTGSGPALFSTGEFTGDGHQASHWTDNGYGRPIADCQSGTPARGLMDPTSGKCEMLALSSLDFAAFDAIGWNLAGSVRDIGNMRITSAQIAVLGQIDAVPEPASWAMFVLGFGGIGGVLRRRPRRLRPFEE